MNRHSLPVMVYIVAAILLVSCSSTDTIYQEKLKQDEYLKRNYPDKKPANEEKRALKTNYYNQITAGEIVVGMSLQEALLATKNYPYGPNRGNTVYWCNEQQVDACDVSCANCTATLFTAKQLHLLEGKQDKMSVVKSIPRSIDDTVARYQQKPFRVVNALFLNQAVPGMTIKDFQRLEQLPISRTEFYCKSQRVFQSCLLDCGECTVRIITPRDNQYHIQTVRFKGFNDYSTIVDVSTTIAAANP